MRSFHHDVRNTRACSPAPRSAIRVAREVTSVSKALARPAIQKGYGSRSDNKAKSGQDGQATASHLAGEQAGELLDGGERDGDENAVLALLPAGFVGDNKANVAGVSDDPEARP